MEKTKDYSIFKEFNSNRELDLKHVARLVKSIRSKNLLKVNPIIVDEYMRVVDGQHRLAAARELGVEIYYIKDGVERKDISVLNSNQKNWNAMDYINFWTVEKVDSFKQLFHLINRYPKMPVSALLSLSSSTGSRNVTQLKDGYLDVLEIKHASEICDLCIMLDQKYASEFVFDSRFPMALSDALKDDKFNAETFFEKIDGNPRAFVRCHTKVQYKEMIEEIYNRGLSVNKIRLT